MADQLQFRGGTTSEVSAASVASREIFIDTQTNQIAVGTSKKKTVMEESNGNVTIDGYLGLPQSPTALVIGVGDRGGSINQYQSGSVANAGLEIEAIHSQSSQIAFKTTGTQRALINQQGNLLVGGTLPSSPSIDLNPNGTSVFTRNVRLGTNPGTVSQNTSGTLFYNYAYIAQIKSNTESNPFLKGQTYGGGTKYQIDYDGSAKFAGPVSIGGTTAANTIDEYEEGTTTVDLTVGGVAAGLTGGNAQGTYTRIGNIVTVQINLNISSASVSGLTGNLAITGLPFASVNSTRSNYSTAVCSITNWATDYKNGSKTIIATNSANSTALGLYAGSRLTTGLDETALNFSSGNCFLYVTFTYRI